MAEFLAGKALTDRIKWLLRESRRAKIAVAYWGGGALELLGIDAKQYGIQVLCCLKGGKSDPDIVKQFRKRAKQHDRLHAKVIWTPDGAIVGSANASSNGMPEDDDHTASLIEAGMYETSPKELAAIEKWFDALYGKARNIGKADLDAARSARAMRKRVFGIKPETTRKSRQSLLEALRDSPVEFSKQRIKLLLYKDPISKAEDRAAQKLQQENRSEVAKGLNINTAELRRLSWLSGDWKDMPKNTFLIEGHYNAGKLRNIHVVKSFDAIRSWPIQAAGRWETITFVLGSGYEGFDYQLTTKDKNAISAAANGLWKIGRGDNLARYVRLLDARPLLLAQG